MCLKCWLQKFILDMSFDMISWYVDFRSWNDVGDALWYASMSSGLIRSLIWYLAWEIITIISFWHDTWYVHDMIIDVFLTWLFDMMLKWDSELVSTSVEMLIDMSQENEWCTYKRHFKNCKSWKILNCWFVVEMSPNFAKCLGDQKFYISKYISKCFWYVENIWSFYRSENVKWCDFIKIMSRFLMCSVIPIEREPDVFLTFSIRWHFVMLF